MSLTLTQTKTAIAPGRTSSFLGVGGFAPYVYAVTPGGAGGSIDPTTGVYTAPALVNPDPKLSSDIITVTDVTSAQASSSILVTSPLGLVCDIIQREMNLAQGRVYFWDQKINQPTDSDLYIAVSVLRCKPFANTTRFMGDGTTVQSVNMMAQLSIDAISRGPAARDRKEEILMALSGLYSQSQQEQNSFLIGKLPPGGQFVNLSLVDGAAIPYRFNITVNIQYASIMIKPANFYDDFTLAETINTA